jgi:hypothetical protein
MRDPLVWHMHSHVCDDSDRIGLFETSLWRLVRKSFRNLGEPKACHHLVRLALFTIGGWIRSSEFVSVWFSSVGQTLRTMNMLSSL